MFREINKKTWLALLLIILIGFMLRMWFVPHTHHVYFDEFEHINIAENFMYQGEYYVTLKGTNNFVETHEFSKWPPGYHIILSLAFSIFGNSEYVAYNLSAVIGSISILVVFLMAHLLFNNQAIALYSAFLFNLIPVHLKYSGASSLCVTSLFFVLLTILASFVYIKSTNIKSLLLLIAVMAFTIYVRPENGILLLLIPVLVMMNVNIKDFYRAKIYSHIFLSLSLLLLFLTPYFLHVYLDLFAFSTGYSNSLMARFANLKAQLLPNTAFWFSNFHPLSFTIIGIFGMLRLVKKNKKVAFFFSMWFLLFLFVFSQHSLVNFNGPDNDRYTLNLYISLIIFSAFGIFEFINLFKFKKKIIIGFILGYIVIEIFSPLRLSLNKTFPRDVHKEYQFILSNKDIIPDDIYVISFIPSVIISTVHKMAIAPKVLIRMEQMPQELILFKDYWWYYEGLYSNAIEKRLKEVYEFELLAEKRVTEAKSISFIKLKMKDRISRKVVE